MIGNVLDAVHGDSSTAPSLWRVAPCRRHVCCDLIEHQRVLLFAQRFDAQPFGAATEAASLQDLHRRRRPRNALVGGFGHRLKMRVALFDLNLTKSKLRR